MELALWYTGAVIGGGTGDNGTGTACTGTGLVVGKVTVTEIVGSGAVATIGGRSDFNPVRTGVSGTGEIVGVALVLQTPH